MTGRADVTFRFVMRTSYFEDKSEEKKIKGTPGECILFLPRSRGPEIHHRTVVHTSMVTGAPFEVTLSLPECVTIDTPVMVWWSPRRYMTGDKHIEATNTKELEWNIIESKGNKPQPYSSIAGYGSATIVAIQNGTDIIIRDIDGVQVAVVHAVIVKVADRAVELIQPQPLVSAKSVAVDGIVARAEKAFSLRGTNITELSSCAFTTVRFPFGQQQLAAFAYGATHGRHMNRSDKENNDLFLGLLTIAMHAIGIVGEREQLEFNNMIRDRSYRGDPAKTAKVVELNASMETITTTLMLYVADTRKGRWREEPTDDWAFPRPHGVTADDCEGLTAIVLELNHRFRSSAFTAGSTLYELQAFDRRYLPFFCVVSIATSPGNYTYHACLIKLDATWVRWKLYGDRRQPVKEELLPVVVLESTNTTTSCRSFKDDGYVNESLYKHSHLSEPVESNPKAPLSMLGGVYRHVVVGVSQDLIDEKRVARVDFVYRKRTGVPFASLYQYDAEIDLLPTIMSSEEHTALTTSFDNMPWLSPIRPIPPHSKAVAITRVADSRIAGKNPPVFDACYRSVDWERGMEDLIMKKANLKTIEVARLAVNADLSGIRVRGWM